jgi:hypothetical protein
MIEWLIISCICFVLLVGCSRLIDTQSEINEINVKVISTEEECSAEVIAGHGQEAGSDKRELKKP